MSFNFIQGVLPPNTSLWVELKSLDLMQNKIYGAIPEDITHLKSLQVMNLAHNNISGIIPPSLSNISSLINLNLGTNTLSGTIPSDLTRIPNLKVLDLTINNLSGTVRPAIYNMSSLVSLVLASNNLWGTIPSDIGTTLLNLLVFRNCFNEFTGVIPEFLQNLTDIQVIRMAHNQLTGTVPPGLENLPGLEMFIIGYNNIVSTGYNGINFLTLLTNSTRLNYLAINSNQLVGVIPESIRNLSQALSKSYMGENLIYGNIPPTIGRLTSLTFLDLAFNRISGQIPRELGQLQNLQELNLARNMLSGTIPTSLGDARQLIELDLSRNEHMGNIPTSLGALQRLLLIDFSNNMLNGRIPKEVLNIPSLSKYLNLSNNILSGLLPWEIGKLESIIIVELSHNNLFGSIPKSIGNCKSLDRLLMATNKFSGQIPNSLETVTGFEILDLSSNKLVGLIPDGLQALQYLNLSFNDLEGQVPTEGVFVNTSASHLEGNPRLCFRCGKDDDSKGKVVIISVCIAAVIAIALCIAISLNLNVRNSKITINSSSNSLERRHKHVSYDDLRIATDNFNEEKLIGKGSFGSVYKGYLHEGDIVSIKVLNIEVRGSFESFLVECTPLRNLRHRNLVKLITTCSSVDFKNMNFLALMYEYMGNGSLDDWVTGKRRNEYGGALNIIERVNVATDIACAMEYLHYGCGSQVVHCDIKPSNILLDEEMTAKVGDFGLVKLFIGENSSDQSTHGLKGSIGYIPPEYGMGEKTSTARDVYSYGITLLEFFTGKKLTNESFVGGLSLRKFVEMNYPSNIENVLDPNLLPRKEILSNEGRSIMPQTQHNCLVGLLELGLACTYDSSDGRISMKDAHFKLKSIRSTLLKPHYHDSHGKEKVDEDCDLILI